MCSRLSVRAEALSRAAHQKRDFDGLLPVETPEGVRFPFPLYEVDINPGADGQDYIVVARQFELRPNSTDRDACQHTYNLQAQTYQSATWVESYNRANGGGYFQVAGTKGEYDERGLTAALAEGLQENVLDPLLACLRT